MSKAAPISFWLPPLSWERVQKTLSSKKVQEAALRVLLELSISLGVVILIAKTTTVLFNPLSLLAIPLMQLTVSSFFEILEPFSRGKEERRACLYFRSAYFALTLLNGQNLLHEAGHVIAAKTLFSNARPKIYASMRNLSYETRYKTSTLSSWGALVGRERACSLVSLAGPVLSLGASSLVLKQGLSLQKKHPTFSRYLIAMAITDFVFHIFYALSALKASPTNFSHDFIRIQALGIHPLMAAFSMALIPFLIFRASSGTHSHQEF